MRSLPLPPTRLPAFAPLINGDLWQRWSDQRRVFALDEFRKAVRYVRLKPTTSCRLAVFNGRPGTDEDPPPGFLLHLYPDRDRAKMAFDKASARKHLIGSAGYEPFLCEEHFVVAVPFPNDAGIPGLRHFYRPYRARTALAGILRDYPTDAWAIRRRLTELTLLAYKPGRRAVYRVEAELDGRSGQGSARARLHAKLENPSTFGTSYGNLLAVHAGVPPGSGWGVPAPLGAVGLRSLVATEWVEGEPLVSLLGTAGEAEAFRATGRALAGLHGIAPGKHGFRAVRLTDGLFDMARDLAQVLPEEERRLLGLADRLASAVSTLPAEADSLVHGDCHPGQVIVGDGRPIVVDWDQAGTGCAAGDVGSFLANLDEHQTREEPALAFLDGYREASPGGPDDGSIAACTALAAFRRAIFPLRELRPDWPDRVRSRLDYVESRLKRPAA